jgi:hypothetical protein
MGLQQLESERIQRVANLPASESAIRNRNNGTLRRIKIVNNDFAVFAERLT